MDYVKLKQANGREYELVAFKTLDEFGTYALLKDLNPNEIEPYVVAADLTMDDGEISWLWGNYYTSFDNAKEKYNSK